MIVFSQIYLRKREIYLFSIQILIKDYHSNELSLLDDKNQSYNKTK